MNAFDSLRLDDLRQRQQGRGETLNAQELALLERLDRQARHEYEHATPGPRGWEGGHADMF